MREGRFSTDTLLVFFLLTGPGVCGSREDADVTPMIVYNNFLGTVRVQASRN